MKKEYSELEIINLLEANGIEVSYTSVQELKEELLTEDVINESWFSKYTKKKKVKIKKDKAVIPNSYFYATQPDSYTGIDTQKTATKKTRTTAPKKGGISGSDHVYIDSKIGGDGGKIILGNGNTGNQNDINITNTDIKKTTGSKTPVKKTTTKKEPPIKKKDDDKKPPVPEKKKKTPETIKTKISNNDVDPTKGIFTSYIDKQSTKDPVTSSTADVTKRMMHTLKNEANDEKNKASVRKKIKKDLEKTAYDPKTGKILAGNSKLKDAVKQYEKISDDREDKHLESVSDTKYNIKAKFPSDNDLKKLVKKEKTHMNALNGLGKQEYVKKPKEKEEKPAQNKDDNTIYTVKGLKEDTMTNRFFSEKYTNELLNIFLVEECGMTLNEYENLSSDTKIESIKEIALRILSSVEEKIKSIDSTAADRSRGDIKQLRELPFIQDAITQLETLIERDENAIPEYSKAIGTIIKSILYINQYANVFKDAYRNKKTLMILKYESLILSIIASVSYLISTIVDYKTDYLTLKKNVENIADFAPLKALDGFIKSVDAGEFKIVTNDVSVLREYYLEVPVEKMSMIMESTDYLALVVDGVKSIYQDVVGNGKLTNLIYRAVGAIVLLFSLRDAFYTLFRMKTKVSEMLGSIQTFADVNGGGNILQKLSQFSNKFRVDAENSSDLTKNEIEDENRRLLNQVRTINSSKASTIQPAPAKDSVVSNSDVFDFDF